MQSVQPMGQPISHSVKAGLRTLGFDDLLPAVPVVGARWPEPEAVAWPGTSGLVWGLSAGVHSLASTARLVIWLRGPPDIRCLAANAASGLRWESRAAGVGHIRTARSVNVIPCALVAPGLPPEPRESPAVAVGQDPQAVAALRRANGGRAETRPLCIEPESGKVPQHDIESSNGQGRDVLKERQRRDDLGEDPGDLRPEPPVVLGAAASAGAGEGLAGEAGSDEIHAAAPRAAIEGLDVVPDRSLIQALVFHPRHEDGRRKGVPLDIAHSPVAASEREAAPELEPAGACAQSKSSQGTCSHVTGPPAGRLVGVAGALHATTARLPCEGTPS